MGICLDTGTTRSMIGWNQFLALSKRMKLTPTLYPVDREFRCGNGVVPSMGYFIFRLPVGPSYFVPIQVDVLKVNNPFLLGPNDMKSMKMQIDVEAMTWKVWYSGIPAREKKEHDEVTRL
jgi:hypothetical protein